MGNRIEFTDRDGVNGVTTVLWTDALRQAVAAPGIEMNVEPVEGGRCSRPTAGWTFC